MFKNILVPLDGSPFAERALAMARQLSLKFNSDLTLCSVLMLDRMTFETPELVLETRRIARNNATNYLNGVEQSLRSEGLPVKSVVIERGSTADAILHLANNGDYDLMVMTTHGRTGIRRWVMGSVAEMVVRRSDIPVLLVRPTSADSAIDEQEETPVATVYTPNPDYELVGNPYSMLNVRFVPDEIVNFKTAISGIIATQSADDSSAWLDELGKRIGRRVVATNSYAPTATQTELATRVILRSLDIPYSVTHRNGIVEYSLREIELNGENIASVEQIIRTAITAIAPDKPINTLINPHRGEGWITLPTF